MNKTRKLKPNKNIRNELNKLKQDINENREKYIELDIKNNIEEKTDLKSDICEICNNLLIINEDGFNLCSNTKCSILYTNTFDQSPEWKFFNNDDKVDPSRCGNPINPLLQESSFSGKILCGPNSSNEMRKVGQWTKWKSMPHKEKSLNDEFQYITIIARNSGINEIFINHATHIYKDLLDQKMFRGINRDSIKASSIYMACRLNGYPRTAYEISKIFNIDRAVANSGCSIASDLMHNIERSIEPSLKLEICSITPLTFIERYCCHLNFEEKYILLAKFIVNELENNNIIHDNNPQTITSGIILFISIHFNLNIKKNDIKDISGVSPVSMTKVLKKLELIKKDLIPNCFLPN
jgi:transcription initiation factor TFIIB